MDKILFKGLDLKKKLKKPRSYKIKNFDGYEPVKLFNKEYQNIIYPFINLKQNLLIEDYLSCNKIKDTMEALHFDGHKDILIISKDNLDKPIKISSKKYLYVIMDDCFVKCKVPYIIFRNNTLDNKLKNNTLDNKLKNNTLDIVNDLPSIQFIYRHKFINGTKDRLKHLVIDQLVDDPSNTIIYTKDKDILSTRYENISFIDNISKDSSMYACRRFVFYDLYENVQDVIKKIEWCDNLTIFSIYTLDEKDKVKRYVEKIKGMVTIDKEILEFCKED